MRSAAAWLLRRLLRAWARLSRGKTLGARAVVLNAAGEIVLVRHTYMCGWWLPGGGIERGETAEAALRRELVEEAGVEAIAPPTLLSIHSNDPRFPGDHVLLYRLGAGDWRPCEARPAREIAEVRWFALDALPGELAGGTCARIEEAVGGARPSPYW